MSDRRRPGSFSRALIASIATVLKSGPPSGPGQLAVSVPIDAVSHQRLWLALPSSGSPSFEPKQGPIRRQAHVARSSRAGPHNASGNDEGDAPACPNHEAQRHKGQSSTRNDQVSTSRVAGVVNIDHVGPQPVQPAEDGWRVPGLPCSRHDRPGSLSDE